MDIEIQKEDNKDTSPIIGVYDIRLKVDDGIKFGFGFGIGMIILGIISFVIFSVITGLLVKSTAKSFTSSFSGTPRDGFIKSIVK